MQNMWSLSVRRRENDPPDRFLPLLRLEFMGSDHANFVLPHRTAGMRLEKDTTIVIQKRNRHGFSPAKN